MEQPNKFDSYSCMNKHIINAARIIKDAAHHFDLADGWAMASHVALSTLLALFPFLIFATTLASYFGSSEFAATAVQLAFDTWPQSIAEPLSREVSNVLTVQRGGLLTFSVIAAGFFASNGVEALRVALNRAYRVSETRNFLVLRLHSLGFVLLGTIGMLAVSLLLVVAPLVIQFTEEIVHIVPWFSEFSVPNSILRVGLAVTLLAIGLFTVHKWLPSGDRSFFALLPGIVFTLVCWAVGASLFALYLENFAIYSTTYAGLASIMIALIFLYIVAAIFILGAELNAALSKHRNRRTPPLAP